MPGGAWLFDGRTFSDDRGGSCELFDTACWLSDEPPFALAQENLVVTNLAGTARGLHYQIGTHAQAKLVTVISGAAQFFWLTLKEGAEPMVHSVVIDAGATSLYTGSDCAHGFLAIKPETSFLLKMSERVSLSHRGEINLLADDLSIDFAVPILPDLRSERDRQAPRWSERRRD